MCLQISFPAVRSVVHRREVLTRWIARLRSAARSCVSFAAKVYAPSAGAAQPTRAASKRAEDRELRNISSVRRVTDQCRAGASSSRRKSPYGVALMHEALHAQQAYRAEWLALTSVRLVRAIRRLQRSQKSLGSLLGMSFALKIAVIAVLAVPGVLRKARSTTR